MNFFKKFIKRGTSSNLSNLKQTKNIIIPETSNLKYENQRNVIPINKEDYDLTENSIYSNNFSNSDTSKSMLRTIIDTDVNYEDIFSNFVYKSKSSLPEQSEEYKGRITLFIPLDDVLLHSFVPDENLGMSEMPKYRDYNFRIELNDYKTFAFLYYRDYLEEFLHYIDQNFEPILYSTAEKIYVDKIMDLIDPNKIFPYRLYQEDCHLYKNSKQNVAEYLKDINLFTNRNLKRKILLEFSPLNYILSPDNSNIYKIIHM
jgi:TFIIF-interacting CTD phosphatase-like protein